MRDGEPQVYAALATMRNGYMQTQWQRVQMFLIINTVALPLVLGTDAPDQAKMFISLVGAMFHFLLLQAVWRANSYMTHLEVGMVALEQLDQQEGDPNRSRVPVFSHPDFMRMRSSWLGSRRSFTFFCFLLTAFWFWQSGQYVIQFFRN